MKTTHAQQLESYINGNRIDFKKWFYKLTKIQEVCFLAWLYNNHTDNFSDVIDYLNN